MDNFILWLEAHDKLSGWAQFFGAVLALLITYFTAFAPLWRRKRQLQKSAMRILSNGFESIESYHRTSEHFLPFPFSLRVAAMTMAGVAEDIDRFPVYELPDQGSRSVARHMIAMSMTLKGLKLFLENQATELDDRTATQEDHKIIRTFVGDRLKSVHDMLTGAVLERPVWPTS